MTEGVVWRSAVRADRGKLMRFSCTEPGRKNPLNGWKHEHPRPWEYQVQSALRSLEPFYKPPWFLLVGVQGGEIVAAAYYEELDGPGQVHVNLLAVAKKHRRAGGTVARELGQELQGRLIDRALQAEVDEILLTAFVHPENAASRRLCEEAGLAVTATTPDGFLVYAIEHFLVFNVLAGEID